MKRLLFPFCYAAVAVSATELKDPARVASDLKRVIHEARAPLVIMGTLANQIAHKPAFKPQQSAIGPGLVEPPPTELPAFGPMKPDTPLYDAPSHRRPRKLPHDRPPGVMPWGYDDPSHRLVPLTPAGQN